MKLFLKRVEKLKEKAKVLLFQFPPNFKINVQRLKDLLEILPQTYKYSFEFRHESWFKREIYELLKKYNASFCIADWPDFGITPQITSDFIYIRRHGYTKEGNLYAGCYSNRYLKNLADFIIKSKLPAYIYFNNDAYGYAILNSKQLKDILERF